jgi:HEAT repeat protein
MAPSPFAKRSAEEWINVLQQSASADDRYRALLGVNSTGSPQQALEWSARSLGDADSGVRALAAKQLRELKSRSSDQSSTENWSKASTSLQQCLNDEDPDVRFEAARTLTQVAPECAAARNVLLALLDDEGTQPLMLAVVVTAVGERLDLSPELMLSRFQRLLAHPQAEVRENSSAIVCQWGTRAAPLVEELITALDDDEPIVRENAAIALGACGVTSEQMLKALEIAATDEDEGVAAAARSACVQLRR